MRLFDDVASRVDDPYLRHAVSLALRGRGRTAPNPLVGCVVVADDEVVGEGYHPQAGQPHAEVFALADAGSLARGSTVYVTLEPCAHHGKTPPCTDALIAAGVRRVVVGLADPNPLARGGAQVLRDAGIEVQFAQNPEPFAEINTGWLKRLATGLPLVVVKVALSLDGHGAFSASERSSITGSDGARVTRRLRAQCDAVVVGAATVVADDPALTVREADGSLAEHQPLRVVIARSVAPRSDTRIFRDMAAPTLLLVPDDGSTLLHGVPEHVFVEHFDSQMGLHGVFAALGARGLNEILIEAGPRLLTSLWEQDAIDELVTVTAGGMAGPNAPASYLGTPSRAASALTHDMTPVEAGIVGDVAATVWRPSDRLSGL